MKIGYWLLWVFVCLTVVFWGMFLKARASVQPVYDVLSIDERILQLREDKFAKCWQITTVPLDKFDVILKTCWEHLTLQ